MSFDQKTLVAAVKEAKEKSGKRNFNQSIEFILSLKDIDMNSPEGRIREIVELPNSVGKPNKICVFATGELALQAKKANADLIFNKAELEGLAGKKRNLRKIANEYDFFIAETTLMPLVGKIFGPTLGPRGKMPLPAPPSVDIKNLIAKHHRTVILRMRNQPILQCRVGTENINNEEIVENIQTVLRVIEAKLKRGAKNIKGASIKTTMGTPVKIKP